MAEKKKMEPNEFYSVVLKKKIMIPPKNIREITKKGRRWKIGTYSANGKKYEAWKVIGKA